MTDYAVVNTQTRVVFKSYSGYGSIPDPVVWPNGDATHATVLGAERVGHRFVEVVHSGEAPGEFYHVAGYSSALDKQRLVHERQWQSDDIEKTRSTIIERANRDAEMAILEQVSLAEIIASVARLVPGEAWSETVLAIEETRTRIVTKAKAAKTVEEIT